MFAEELTKLVHVATRDRQQRNPKESGCRPRELKVLAKISNASDAEMET